MFRDRTNPDAHLVTDLRALGATLEAAVGAPLRRDRAEVTALPRLTPSASAPGSGSIAAVGEEPGRRRWLLPLAAACVVTGFVAVAAVVADGPEREVRPAGSAEVPVDYVELGVDPLGLLGDTNGDSIGWLVLTYRSVSTRGDDASPVVVTTEIFVETEGAVALSGSGELQVGVMVVADPAQAAAMVDEVIAVDDPAGATRTPLELDLELPAGVSVDGYSLDEPQFQLVLVRGTGNLVVYFEFDETGITDEALTQLVERAAALQLASPWVEVDDAPPIGTDPG